MLVGRALDSGTGKNLICYGCLVSSFPKGDTCFQFSISSVPTVVIRGNGWSQMKFPVEGMMEDKSCCFSLSV